MEYAKLPLTKTRTFEGGTKFNFTQIARDDKRKLALYRVMCGKQVVSFELFKIKVQKATKIERTDPKTKQVVVTNIEAKEAWPNDNAFGKWAWTYPGKKDENKVLDWFENWTDKG